MKASDIKIDKLHCIFTGESGTGKTWAAASFPKPFFFDFDKGCSTLKGHRKAKEIEVEEINSVADMERQLQVFKKDCPFKTLVFDSMTCLTDILLTFFAGLNGHLDKDGRPQLTGRGAIGILEYGQRVTWLQNFLMSLLRQPCHTIVICHEETIKDEILGNIITRAAIPGKQLPTKVPGLADEVWRFEMVRSSKGAESRVHTVGTGRFVAKCRLDFAIGGGVIPPMIPLKQDDSLFDIISSYASKGGKA